MGCLSDPGLSRPFFCLDTGRPPMTGFLGPRIWFELPDAPQGGPAWPWSPVSGFTCLWLQIRLPGPTHLEACWAAGCQTVFEFEVNILELGGFKYIPASLPSWAESWPHVLVRTTLWS